MKQLLKNQRGAFDIMLILVFLLFAMGFGGYVYYQQQQAQKSYDAASKGVVVAKQSKKKKSAKKAPSSAQAAPAVADSWFVINQFAVEGKPTAGVTLQYSIKTNEGIPSAYFTSAEQLALEPACTAAFGPGGTISQYPAGADYHGSAIETNPAAKKVGNYYYIFDQPQAYCSVAMANQDKEAAIQAAVKNILATLQVKP